MASWKTLSWCVHLLAHNCLQVAARTLTSISEDETLSNSCLGYWTLAYMLMHLMPSANRSVSAVLPENPQTTRTILGGCKHCEFLCEGLIRCTLFKYLFPFVEEANLLLHFLQAVNIDCRRGRDRGGSISITAFHYMADDSRAECASSMQPHI